MASMELGRPAKEVAGQMKNQSKFVLVLLALNSIFYFGGKWLPWRIGMFAIERYPYGEPYQIMFLIFISLILYFCRSYLTMIGFQKLVAVGFIAGFVSSLLAYIVSYSLFYVDTVSLIGLNNLIELSISDALGSWIQIIVLSFMLLGWLYGVIFAIFIYKTKNA